MHRMCCSCIDCATATVTTERGDAALAESVVSAAIAGAVSGLEAKAMLEGTGEATYTVRDKKTP